MGRTRRGAARPRARVHAGRRRRGDGSPPPWFASGRHACPAQHSGGRLPPTNRPDAGGDEKSAGRAPRHWLTSYRRTWRGTAVSSVITPLLFLTAMGLGFGGYVNAGSGQGDGFRSAV